MNWATVGGGYPKWGLNPTAGDMVGGGEGSKTSNVACDMFTKNIVYELSNTS